MNLPTDPHPSHQAAHVAQAVHAQRYERCYDGARINAIQLTVQTPTLRATWTQGYLVLLDDTGSLESIMAEGHGWMDVQLPAAAFTADEQALLRGLLGSPCTLTEVGLRAEHHELLLRRELTAANGVSLIFAAGAPS